MWQVKCSNWVVFLLQVNDNDVHSVWCIFILLVGLVNKIEDFVFCDVMNIQHNNCTLGGKLYTYDKSTKMKYTKMSTHYVCITLLAPKM